MNSRNLALLSLIFLAGCEPPAAGVMTGSGPPPPPVGVQSVDPVSPEQPADFVAAEESPASPVPALPGDLAQQPVQEPHLQEPEPTVSPSATPPAAGRQFVRLSAGVALPQLLPEGTHIGVSVDYKVTGQLNGSAKYLLIVESAAGEVAVPVELSLQGGTIQGFLNAAVRPEHKPFTARIDEVPPGSKSSVQVSNKLGLATSY